MDDGRDAEDARLLDRGDHARLLAKYEPVIVGRCVAALRGSLDAEDVAQDVKTRLWREFKGPYGRHSDPLGDPRGSLISMGWKCGTEARCSRDLGQEERGFFRGSRPPGSRSELSDLLVWDLRATDLLVQFSSATATHRTSGHGSGALFSTSGPHDRSALKLLASGSHCLAR
jgi:hypothetical protein